MQEMDEKTINKWKIGGVTFLHLKKEKKNCSVVKVKVVVLLRKGKQEHVKSTNNI